jgi:hypothetical protein
MELATNRFLHGPGILYLAFVALVLALTIFRAVIRTLCLRMLAMCCKGHANEDTEELRASQRIADIAAGNDKFSVDIISDLRIPTLADKYRKSVVDL